MPDYLTKEEMRQWRSSLEKITLEDYAKKLGKVINEEKETNEIVDIVYKHSSEVRTISADSDNYKQRSSVERITSLAHQSFEREKELSLQKAERDLKKAINKPKKEIEKQDVKKEIAKPQAPKEIKQVKAVVKEVKPIVKQEPMSVREEVQVTFKKNLTPREQAVFEHFLNNKNSIVYAKELAQVLDLPRDYVYKYIKNLRAKMNENALQNADNGGFVLQIK